MSERRMTKVVSQCNRLHKILIQAKCLGYSTCDLGYLQSVRQPVPVMISFRSQKNLSLILHPAKSFAMQDPVPVSLVNRPDVSLFFLPVSSSGTSTVCGIRTQQFQFSFFHALSDIHISSILQRLTGKPIIFLLLIIFYTKFQIPLFFKKNLKIFNFFQKMC